MDIGKTLDISLVLTIVQMIPLLAFVWMGIVAARGLLRKKRQAPEPVRKKLTHFGIIVCAHNEENAIGSLFQSIENQAYPENLIHVFLLADHCSDGTAQIGRRYSFATVLEM